MLATQLLEAIADKGPWPSYRLEDVAARWLGVELNKTHQQSDWSGELSQEQLAYAGGDAGVLLPLYERLSEELASAGLMRVALLEMEALPAVAWLEQSGAPFDAEAWRALSDGMMAEQVQLERELDAVLGAVDLFGPRGVNWSSPRQFVTALRARGHDVQNADRDVLQRVAAQGEPLAPLLLRFREAMTRSSRYGIAYLQERP